MCVGNGGKGRGCAGKEEEDMLVAEWILPSGWGYFIEWFPLLDFDTPIRVGVFHRVGAPTRGGVDRTNAIFKKLKK